MSHRLPAFALAGVWFCLDRATKLLVQANFGPQDVLPVIPSFFNLIYTENRGMAFSLLADNESEWRSFFLIGLTALVLAFVTAVLWQSSPKGLAASHWSRTGLSLILGGALGNLWDRVTSGAVTDFLDFYVAGYHWPAFNLADTGLTAGAALVILDLWRSRERRPA